MVYASLEVGVVEGVLAEAVVGEGDEEGVGGANSDGPSSVGVFGEQAAMAAKIQIMNTTGIARLFIGYPPNLARYFVPFRLLQGIVYRYTRA